MGIVAVEIRHNYAPDHRRHHQEAPEAHSGDAGSVFVFFRQVSVAWGGWGSSLFVPRAALLLGGLKEQDICKWFLTTRVLVLLVPLKCWGWFGSIREQ